MNTNTVTLRPLADAELDTVVGGIDDPCAYLAFAGLPWGLAGYAACDILRPDPAY